MLKNILVAGLLSGVAAASSFAQSTVTVSSFETRAKYDKKDENAVTANYNVSKDIMSKTLEDYFKKANIGKKKSSKGYNYFEGAVWNVVSNDRLDVYYKVDGKKDNSTVTFLLSKGYSNFVSSATDPQVIANLQAFLNNLTVQTAAYQLQVNTDVQSKTVEKAQKEYDNSVKDGQNLQSDLEKLQKKILENQQKQSQLQNSLTTEQQKLTDLKNSGN